MPICESSKDYGTGGVLMLWDGERPSNVEFLEYAKKNYGVTGKLSVTSPSEFRGLKNLGSAEVQPNT